MNPASPEEVRRGIEVNEERSIAPALLLKRLTGIARAGGRNREIANKLSWRVREALFKDEPLLGRAATKQVGELLKDGFTIARPGTTDPHPDNDVFQAWWRDGFLDAKVREALILAHIHPDGPVEIEWSDEGEGQAPVRPGAVPVDVHPIDPTSIRFERLRDADGRVKPFLVQNVTGDSVTLHPERYHAFRHLELLGSGVSTVERAYNASLSKVKADQALGEILYFSGNGKLVCLIKEGQDTEIESVTKMVNDPDFVRALVWKDNLTVTQLQPTAVDPANYYRELKISIAAAFGIPVMMLEGAQAGATTGSETNLTDFQSDIRQAKVFVLEPFVTRLYEGLTGHEPGGFDTLWRDPTPPRPKLGEQANAFQVFRDGGLKPLSAARLAGLNVTEEDFEEAPEVLPPVRDEEE